MLQRQALRSRSVRSAFPCWTPRCGLPGSELFHRQREAPSPTAGGGRAASDPGVPGGDAQPRLCLTSPEDPAPQRQSLSPRLLSLWLHGASSGPQTRSSRGLCRGRRLVCWRQARARWRNRAPGWSGSEDGEGMPTGKEELSERCPWKRGQLRRIYSRSVLEFRNQSRVVSRARKSPGEGGGGAARGVARGDLRWEGRGPEHCTTLGKSYVLSAWGGGGEREAVGSVCGRLWAHATHVCGSADLRAAGLRSGLGCRGRRGQGRACLPSPFVVTFHLTVAPALPGVRSLIPVDRCGAKDLLKGAESGITPGLDSEAPARGTHACAPPP